MEKDKSKRGGERESERGGEPPPAADKKKEKRQKIKDGQHLTGDKIISYVIPTEEHAGGV
jgi:hypothetical protein